MSSVGKREKNENLKRGAIGLYFVAVVPPPVTGMTNVSQWIRSDFPEFQVRDLSISRPKGVSNLIWRFYKYFLILIRCVHVVADSSKGKERKYAYLACDSGWGLLGSWMWALVLRLGCVRVVLHHHVATYAVRKDWRMNILSRILGREAIHISQCDALLERMRVHYSSIRNGISISNAAWVSVEPNRVRRRRESLVLGHLSNLTMEKGVGLCVEVFEKLIESGADVRLIIAGPSETEEVDVLLSELRSIYREKIEIRGAVYGEKKNAFFRDIDVFLFPTRYSKETEGIVTLEALANGVPVVAYGRACIARTLSNSGGVVIDPEENFIEKAVPAIESWLGVPGRLEDSAAKSRERLQTLHEEARSAIQKLFEQMWKREWSLTA